jgi:tRNA 2-thiouridine synthesizing protein A
MSDHDAELDASGLNCPLPVLKTKSRLQQMATGEVLRVLATDAGSVMDFEAFARRTGHRLLESSRDGDTYIFRLRCR